MVGKGALRALAGSLSLALIAAMAGIAASATPAVAASRVVVGGSQKTHVNHVRNSPAAVPGDPTIYDSTVNPLPGNVVSLGYQATQTSEFGNEVAFAGNARDLQNVVVTMSSWGCEQGSGLGGPSFGNPGACVTTPGDTFAVPITLNIYNVGAVAYL